jgi:hypothetical protein
MKRLVLLVAAMLIGFASFAADFSASAMAGYKGGLGFRAAGQVSHFAQGFPLGFELGITYSTLDPGNPEMARRIFINEATNGTPEKSGEIWDFAFNFLIPVHVLGIRDGNMYIGVHKSFFTGNFKYIGGNEWFDVTSSPWGFGAGLRASFPMGNNISLVMCSGLDYFPNASLTGHDTSYSPGGEMVNQKEDFAYADADKAINQPKIQGVFMVGIGVGL